MIQSFADKYTQALFETEESDHYPAEIIMRALRKLRMIDAAVQLTDLRSPPANRLHALRGDRVGQYSIRINRGWRICFVWDSGHAYDVEINNHYE